MKEREEGPKCAAEKDDIVAVTDGTRKRVFIGIEVREYPIKGRIRILARRLEVAVELQELWKQRKDERK